MVQPLVSIVIPCYKGARYLHKAIESCLKQTHHHLEIIVVDDGSPDDCARIAQEYSQRDSRVQLLSHQANSGVARAFNTGYHAASGNYFTRLAQDDYFREDAIERMLQHFKTHDVGLVYADEQYVDEQGRLLDLRVTAEPPNALLNANRIGLCVMWSRSAWEAAGDFDPNFDTAEDYEYWIRISRLFRIDKCHAGALLFFRQHNQMGSRSHALRQRFAFARIQCQYFAPADRHKEILAEANWDAQWIARSAGDYVSACRYAFQCIRISPVRWVYWKGAIGTIARLLRVRLRA